MPPRCLIAKGKRGICGVRQNVQGKLMAMTYGMVSSQSSTRWRRSRSTISNRARPFSRSAAWDATWGACIARTSPSPRRARTRYSSEMSPPKDVPEIVRASGCNGVSWTYNEPTMWTEFVIDSGRLCKERGIFTTFVTNGYISEEPLRRMKGIMDAMNIDVKGFTEEFYKNVCKARLAPVLDAVSVAKEMGVHVELTYLIIPGKNDSVGELERFCEWSAGIDGDMPVHFSRFHPDYKMRDVPPTPVSTMEKACKIAKENGVRFAYVGNMTSDQESTYCPECGSLAIKRSGFSMRMVNVKDGLCGKCGASLALVL